MKPNNNYTSIYTAVSGTSCPSHKLIKWSYWIGRFNGLAIGSLIFVKDAHDISVICHELKHVEQFNKQPFSYHLSYLVEFLRDGYRNNRFEQEAYRFQDDVIKFINQPK